MLLFDEDETHEIDPAVKAFDSSKTPQSFQRHLELPKTVEQKILD